MKSKIILNLMLLVFFFASISYASPSINTVSGSFVNGQQIVVTGSGFGSGPTVLLFDDFSGSVDGSKISTTATIGNWSLVNTYGVSDSSLSGGKGSQCWMTGSTGWYGANLVLFGATYSEVFISSMAYIPNGSYFPGTSSVETLPSISALKQNWVYYGSTGYASNNDPDIFGPNWTGSAWYAVSSNDTFRSGYDNADSGTDMRWAWGNPVRWTTWIKGNGVAVSGSDGLFQAVSSAGQTLKRFSSYKAWFTANDTTNGFDRATVPGFLIEGAGTTGQSFIIDDVYIAVGDNAAARIEIGNNATYSSCTKLALLTPDTWSDGQITAVVREGIFKSGEHLYLFVVASDQTVNSGYAVRFGENGTGTLTSGTATITTGTATIH